MEYVEGSMKAYLDKLASKAPEPGGGSASALVGAVGAALVSMVGNLTIGKEKYADVEDKMRNMLDECEEVRERLQKLVVEDTEVYGKLSQVFKMPRDTEEQKTERAAKMEDALKQATEVPMEICEEALKVARLSVAAADHGNVGAVSDAGVGVLFAEATAQGGALNVKINLGSLKDGDFCKSKWNRVEEILKEIASLRERVLETTYSKL